MVTPLLSRLRTEGGTLYTFPSAQRDLARVFANDSYSFKFSRFACLDFPDIKPINYNGDGKFVDLINSFPDVHYTSQNMNTLLAEHFQNYIMNFETAILNGEGDDNDYDNTILRTPAERIFWNWLQKISGIEFEYADRESNLYYEKTKNYDGGDSDSEYSFDPVNLEDHSEYVKNRTVKYIGNIDIINSVEINGDAYNELYIHIPSTVGASYEVRFASVNDDNYNGGNYTLGDEHIIGWDENKGETTPYDLSYQAIYDYDSPNDEGNSEGYSNTYSSDIGYIIDFRDSFYFNDVVGYYDIMTMNELSPDDFEFNCVLIYYDFTDNATGETVTNLYGVLFLEEIMSEGTESNMRNHIQCYPKIKTTNLSDGNSYALKVDIKIDAYPTSNMTATYNNNNQELLDTLQEYMDDMVKLQKTIDIFNRQQSEISSLQNRVHELETLLYGMDSVSSVTDRVSLLETRLNGSGIADQYELTNIIGEVNQKVDDFLGSQDNTSFILPEGYGIRVNRSDDGEITINSTLSSYSLNIFKNVNMVEDGIEVDEDSEIVQSSPYQIHRQDENEVLSVYTVLEEGPNLAVLYVDGDNCSNNLNIYIDDRNVKWKEGQTFKLKIKDYINLDGHYLYIHTGLEDGDWNQHIVISSENVATTPTIEIVCTNTVMKQSAASFIYESVQSGSMGSSSSGSSISPEEITEEQLESLIQETLDN